MDIDNTRLSPLTKQERKRLIKEERCFCCCKIGHQSRNCPGRAMTTKINKVKVFKEPKEKNNGSREKFNSSTATMLSSTSTKVTNVTFTQKDLFNALKNSSKEERAKLMERIMEDEEENF
jgi:hypothetical protein